jgi:hypothetical protein
VKICCGFWERARVTRDRDRDTVAIESSGEGRLVIISFKVMASQPNS